MNPYLDELKNFVLAELRQQSAKVILFGSRARGNASPRSDVDIGILPEKKLALGSIGELKEKIENLNIPYSVDLVDLSEAGPDFRREALRGAVVWKDLI